MISFTNMMARVLVSMGKRLGEHRATMRDRDGDSTRVELDWQVTVNMPLIRYLSPLLKPIFALNHLWTTPRGERGMLRYLRAKHHRIPAATPELALAC